MRVNFGEAVFDPYEIDSFYRGLREIDQAPPQFHERNPGEYARMYRSHGFKLVYGVYIPSGEELTLRQAAMRSLPYVYDLSESEPLYGPLIIEERVVLGGFAWWRKERQ
jgi:hypothetical protein